MHTLYKVVSHLLIFYTECAILMSLGTFPTTFPKHFQKVRPADMANLTIKDIARISGCSVSTISRVINDRPDVRPETKEHVLKVMREAGFVPNTNARQLKIQQSRSLVFVVKGTRNIFFSDFLVQLQRAATLYGYNGIVSYLDENANEIDAAEKILREIKPKGIIFLGGSVANFQRGFDRINVPSVLTTLVTDELDFPNLSMVGVDDRAAAYTAVDYLIRQGHRKIAVLGGPVTSYPSLMRRQGAQQAMEDAGIVFNDKLYGLSNYDFESAYHAMNSLLARRAEFTALFAMSDVIAFGAIRALVSAGLRVPEDVHMGSLAFIAKQNPNNLVHICLNNEAHESVGGMPTGCVGLSYAKVAETVGYEFVYCVDTIEELKQVLNEIKGKRKLTFIEIKVAMESRADLGRPKETAAENKDNFMRYHGVKG